ncbi:MAG: hypothetical protein ACLP9L_19260 [Thermoguttaceae bacterium]
MKWKFVSSPICYNQLGHHEETDEKGSGNQCEFGLEARLAQRQDEILPSSLRKNRYSQHNLQPQKPEQPERSQLAGFL